MGEAKGSNPRSVDDPAADRERHLVDGALRHIDRDVRHRAVDLECFFLFSHNIQTGLPSATTIAGGDRIIKIAYHTTLRFCAGL